MARNGLQAVLHGGARTLGVGVVQKIRRLDTASPACLGLLNYLGSFGASGIQTCMYFIPSVCVCVCETESSIVYCLLLTFNLAGAWRGRMRLHPTKLLIRS